MADPRSKLVALAHLFIGVKEDSENDGPLIRLFQMAVDGRTTKEPWCVGFVQYLCGQVDHEEDDFVAASNGVAKRSFPPSVLYKTEGAVPLWESTPRLARIDRPIPGSIVLWRHFSAQGYPTAAGHAGIVANVISKDVVETIEGNTSPQASHEIVRDGDVVALKRRTLDADVGRMRLIGLLNPWPGL
jgi:hypothetical protein